MSTIMHFLHYWYLLKYCKSNLKIAIFHYRMGSTMLVLWHHNHLGLRVNWEKSKLSPVQRISFLGVELDSVSMTARLMNARVPSEAIFRGSAAMPLGCPYVSHSPKMLLKLKKVYTNITCNFRDGLICEYRTSNVKPTLCQSSTRHS